MTAENDRSRPRHEGGPDKNSDEARITDAAVDLRVPRTSPGRNRADFYRWTRAIGVDPSDVDYRRLAVPCARWDRLLYSIDEGREEFEAMLERVRRRGAAA